MTRPLRVAVVGAGPAGIYTIDALIKSEREVSIDLFERMPAPFGLIRYGVAPDHPRIKGIIQALHLVMDKPQVRLFGNVDFGTDLKLDEMRQFYDAIVFSTGAMADRPLEIPGIDLEGSYGAADFVSWYDGHPDVPRTWPLNAKSVAVLGVGNVAVDVARILAKTADELLVTEIPENVYQGLLASPVEEVHVFGRRGPAQAKFTPMELRELDHSPNVEVIVSPEDMEFDAGSMKAIHSHKQTEMIVKTLQKFAMREPGDRPRKLYLHFLHAPAEVLGAEGTVTGVRTERTELTGDGNVRGTGEFHVWPVQAVYRAVGYLSSPLPDLPFDEATGTIPHQDGKVVDPEAGAVAGIYVSGWIKRGPVGLIGHTKGCSSETVASLLADVDAGALTLPAQPDPEAIDHYLRDRGIEYTTWQGWKNLDAHEKSLGEPHGRERIKVVERAEMIAASTTAASSQ